MKILFLCTGNSCRSQMAEGWARHYAIEGTEIVSAGIESHGKNPKTVIVMQEVGIDISHQSSTVIDDSMLENLDLLVTVCSDANEKCPVIASKTTKEFWPIQNPAIATGTKEEVMAIFRSTRDEIKNRVIELLQRLNIHNPEIQ